LFNIFRRKLDLVPVGIHKSGAFVMMHAYLVSELVPYDGLKTVDV
jgi:hypothetical protein